MPRVLSSALERMLEYHNPRVHLRVELLAVDVTKILRRVDDQFFRAVADDGPLVSPVPLVKMTSSPGGALQLTPTAEQIAAFTTINGSPDLNPENPQYRHKTLEWVVEPGFHGVLREFTAKVQRQTVAGVPFRTRFELQIYRATGVRGTHVVRNAAGVATSATPRIEWSFAELLTPAIVIPDSLVTWVGNVAELHFPLANRGLRVDGRPPEVNPGADATEELNAYYFEVRAIDARDTGRFQWLTDSTTARTVAGVGTFQRCWWARDREVDPWVRTPFADAYCATISIDRYDPAGGSAQAVYVIDLGRAPSADPAVEGRVIFERGLLPGTSATLELSTAGSGGPWAAVTHEQLLSVRQQTYHLRLTLAPDASKYATPLVYAIGVEYRQPFDLEAEAILEPTGMDASAPWLESAIGEGRLSVIRLGRRDFEDLATELATRFSPTQLEARVYLASDHPTVSRADWLLLDRAQVSNVTPTETSEQFTLLSLAARLKRKFPAAVESLNTVHTLSAVAADGQTLTVSPALVDTSGSGGEYTGLNYYMRVRSAANAAAVGLQATIATNDNTTVLRFSPAIAELSALLAPGDVIEVHSGIFNTVPRMWIDVDPADIWWELATADAQMPSERIGLAGLGRNGRSGLPPRVEDICPGDPDGQARRRVTMGFAELEEVGKALQQVSRLMGGATFVIAGQLVFRQIFNLTDATGTVTVAPEPVAAMFDPVSAGKPTTPRGLESRAASVACTYGVDRTAADPDAYPASRTQWTDVDAINFLGLNDYDEQGVAEVPPEIARWCYNSFDAGLQLASDLARQVVAVASTGLRVWTVPVTEVRYDLVPGDSIVLVTDQYTDHDPRTGTLVKGWLAVRGVLVGVSGDRRRLTMLVPGLEAAAQLQGGKAGALGGTDTAAIVVPTVLYAVEKRGRATSWVAYLVASFTPPVTPFFDHMEYAVEQRPMPTAADPAPTWSSPVMVRGTREGTDMLPVPFNVEVRVTPYTVSSGGTRTPGTLSAVYAIGNNPAPEVLAILTTRAASYVDFEVEVDDDTQVLLVYLEERASDPGVAPDLADGTRVPLVWDRRLFVDNVAVIRQEIASASNYACATVVPLDGLSQPGTAASAYDQGDAAALLPLAPASGAHVSTTSTTATVSATLQNPWTSGGSPAPTHLRLYRGGVLQLEAAVTVGAGGTQNLVATGLTPSTTYGSWEVATMAGGVESTRVAVPGSATTAPLALDPPTSVTLTRGGDISSMTLTWAAGANNPGGTTFDLEQWDGVAWQPVETGWGGTSYNGYAMSIPTVFDPTPDRFRVRATATGATPSSFTASNWA